MLSKLGALKKTATKSGHAPKKRGPKSIWGAFILKRLRARNRPMSYDELIADAMSIHKIPEARLVGQSQHFEQRLSPAHRAWKDCHRGATWKKDKRGVDQWAEESGALKPEHAKAFKSIMGGKLRVDMGHSSQPLSRPRRLRDIR